jgi:hypothetical protein
VAETLLLEGLSLTGRMLAKSPTAGYRLWLDTLSGEPDRIYIAEAPLAAVPTDATFRGVRLTLVDGKPLGKVEVAEGFAWDSRALAAWT